MFSKVFINPELRVIDYTKIILPEACESVKGFSADVARYSEVEVTGKMDFTCKVFSSSL